MVLFLSQFCGDGDLITNLNQSEIEYGKSLGYQVPRGLLTKYEAIKLSFWKMIINLQSDPKLKKSSGKKIKKNLSAYLAKQYLGEKTWNTYFKFCFERNPFDKAVSLYFWHTRKFEKRPEINEFIQKMPRSKLSNWDLYTIKNNIAVDFVGKYENLQQDLSKITTLIGIPDQKLPQAKNYTRTNHQHYSELLDESARAYIEKMCAHEIEMFKYYWVGK